MAQRTNYRPASAVLRAGDGRFHRRAWRRYLRSLLAVAPDRASRRGAAAAPVRRAATTERRRAGVDDGPAGGPALQHLVRRPHDCIPRIGGCGRLKRTSLSGLVLVSRSAPSLLPAAPLGSRLRARRRATAHSPRRRAGRSGAALPAGVCRGAADKRPSSADEYPRRAAARDHRPDLRDGQLCGRAGRAGNGGARTPGVCAKTPSSCSWRTTARCWAIIGC